MAMSAFPAGQRSVSHLGRAPWIAALVVVVASACDRAAARPQQDPPAPPPDGASVRASAGLWAHADRRPEIVDAAEKLVADAAAARAVDPATRLSDGRKAGLSAALLLGPLAAADTVVSGRVAKVRQSSFPRDGVRHPVTVVSLSVTGILRGQPAAGAGGALDYWTWTEGTTAPRAGSEILAGLQTRRGMRETHTLVSPGAIFSLRAGAVEMPGIRVAAADIARCLAALQGGTP
jgi:hypothetical protein